MIRIAILAGVSTDAQVKDKLSIPDQLEHCRAYLRANNAVETAGPYIMDGYSRTGYDSLEIAMREIPPLGRAIAEAAQYDILLMDNFDRLGDLGYIVKTRFKKLRKQLHSVRQSGKLIPPELYDPYADDSGDIQMHVEGIIQTYRINKIRRGWNIGIPDRARNGLNPLSLPFGYKLSAPNEPPALSEVEGRLLIELKDLFLSGATLTHLCEHAEASGLRPRRGYKWHRNVVKRILSNPFYAGLTIYGRTRKLDGKKIPVPPSQWITGKGRHVPLWDEPTHHAILAELRQRQGARAPAQYYTLTGLVFCSVCGSPLHRHGKQGTHFIYLNCDNGKDHPAPRYDTALQIISAAVARELKRYNPAAPPDETLTDEHITDLKARRLKVQEGFETGLYTAAEAASRLTEIENGLHLAIRQKERRAERQQTRAALLQYINTDEDSLRRYILEGPPTLVNRLLRALLERITLTPDLQVSITWR